MSHLNPGHDTYKPGIFMAFFDPLPLPHQGEAKNKNWPERTKLQVPWIRRLQSVLRHNNDHKFLNTSCTSEFKKKYVSLVIIPEILNPQSFPAITGRRSLWKKWRSFFQFTCKIFCVLYLETDCTHDGRCGVKCRRSEYPIGHKLL